MAAKKTIKKKKKHTGNRIIGIFTGLFMWLGALGERMPESGIGRALSGLFSKMNIYNGFVRPTKKRVSEEIEQSAVLGFVQTFLEKLLYLPLRAYGTLLMTYTVYAVAIHVLRMYFNTGELISVSLYAKGGVAFLLSLFLLLAGNRKTLASAIHESRICSFILFGMFGIKKQPFEKGNRTEVSMLLVFLVGAALSLLVFVLPLSSLILMCLWLLFWCVTLICPESGLLISAFLVPMMPLGSVKIMILISALSYFIKLVRGKRNLKITFYHWIAIFFAFSVMISGWIRVGGGNGAETSTVLIFLLLFFLISQLFCQREWIAKAATVISLSAVCTAIYGIVLFAIGYLPDRIIRVFTFLPYGKTPFEFTSGESYGLYVALGAAIVIARFWKNEGFKTKAFGSVSLLVLAGGALVSHSPVAWIAAIIAVFFLLALYKNILAVPCLALAVAGCISPLFLSEKILNRIEKFSDGFSVRISTVWDELLSSAQRGFFGTGSGSAAERGNAVTHILTVWGLLGIVLLSTVLLGGLAFGYYSTKKNEKTNPDLIWILCGYEAVLATIVTAGIVSDVFSNGAVLYLLFFVLGMIFATGNILLKESEQQLRSSELDRDYIFIPVVKRAKKHTASGKKKGKEKIAAGKDRKGLSEPVLLPEESEEAKS